MCARLAQASGTGNSLSSPGCSLTGASLPVFSIALTPHREYASPFPDATPAAFRGPPPKDDAMLLAYSTWQEIDAWLTRSKTVVVPIGSNEQHGPTGLLGTD